MHKRLNQKGSVDALLIPLIIASVFALGLAGFGVWSYLSYLDQKDNTDQKIEVAVVDATAKQAEELELEFAEREKEPNRTFTSSATIGSIKLVYPKTWSVFAEEKEGDSRPLNAFFHPKYVPATNTLYALRASVSEQDYAKEVRDFEREIEDGTVTATPIEKSGVAGTRFDGQIDKDFRGAMVIFPLRDKTLKIWTESEKYLKDFNQIVLKNLTFQK